MADPSKHIERAEKLLEKGKPEHALADFRAALELQPEDQHLLQKAADLSMSLGQLGLASDLLRRLFAQFIESNQLSSATVTFRKLQRMKALDPEIVRRYAELCENTNRRDAAEAYRVAFEEFQRIGDPRRALECLTSSLDLEPRLEDYREQARISEALHQPVLAAAAQVHLGTMLELLGEDASEAYARAYSQDPSNVAGRLGHGRSLMKHDRPGEAIELLQPLLASPSTIEEAREPYARALLAMGRVEEAEPFAWKLFERDPSGNLPHILSIIRGLVDRGRADRALGLASRLEEYLRKEGRRLEFLENMAQIAESSKPTIPVFEYLAQLYNGANREIDYAQVLSRLFDLYFELGNFAKALDALDRAVEIDPYEVEHKARMHKLAGHVPAERLETVAKRIGMSPPEQVAVGAEEESAPEPSSPRVFEDLVLQAEIFLQYGMRDKALEKIKQLQQSFGADLDKGPRLRQLLLSAGLAVPALPEGPIERNRSAEGVVRAAEISRLITLQADPRSVLLTAVNQIGARWQYSRCLAALAIPGMPPSLVVEYCSPEVQKSERIAMVRLLALSQRLTSGEPVFCTDDAQLSEPLLTIRQELAQLHVHSMGILALRDEEDQPIGLFIVQQCEVRRCWLPEDIALLGSLVDQVALAVCAAQGTR